MVFVIEKIDSLPSWLVHKELVWLCNVKKEPNNSKEEINDYIPEPFPEHEFEPLWWNDVLATIDVCANIHAKKHYDEEGYGIMSLYMVKVILDDEEMEMDSSQLIFKDPEMDTF